ncbi:prepilin-type N-terminal cleavage/methylation domain-containing protein [Marinihelvus fidelis]|uniref:Prepilin-type N-terminal cleavage/methylation domain-containing protein n=1 Tax=Marinihelvus fidelis TaxID=2613842 RepID=A0A5N0TC51_9GAMM|nr:prepilin-type N-terminal cleavage/methylation domain-containing protein [Marinihelvus fidelis]KAA9132540.1 prepilin-type N-terminal cleavage/methylation domain-containing protein [Marinihelvus fidelis]
MTGHRGFSLVEVLIAITVMSVGLAALARLSLVGIADTGGARAHSQAVGLASEAAELLRFGAAGYDDWNGGGTAPSSCGLGSPCPPASFTRNFAADWALRVADRLPGGLGAVCRDASPGDGDPSDAACDGTGRYVVKVLWRSPAGTPMRHVVVLP